MPKICGIYKITSPTNKVYIGQSIDIRKRWLSYKNLSCEKQRKLYNSFKKHGVDNHKFKVIHKCDIDELNIFEKFYIDMYTSASRRGLNIRGGGDSINSVSEETKIKSSKARVGKKLSNFKSSYIGVIYKEGSNKWESFCSYLSDIYYIGIYKNEIDAAIAHDIFVTGQNFNRKTNFTMDEINEKRKTFNKKMRKDLRVAKLTSKYRGVNWKCSVWVSQLQVNKKKVTLGRYKTELEAALAYDIYILDNKLSRKTNFEITYINNNRHILNRLEKPKVSIYVGVSSRKRKPCWTAEISVNKKRARLGFFDTEVEAARAYNNYIIENNIDRKLNTINI